WFSDGSYHGKSEIGKAFSDTWDVIHDEEYRLHDIHWLCATSDAAVCTYRFTWKGIIEGSAASGSGRGTNVFIKDDDSWKIVHEHLSKAPDGESYNNDKHQS